MSEDKDFTFICMLVLILVLFFGMMFIGLSYKQRILEQQIQIDKITIERDLYKNLVKE